MELDVLDPGPGSGKRPESLGVVVVDGSVVGVTPAAHAAVGPGDEENGERPGFHHGWKRCAANPGSDTDPGWVHPRLHH